MAQFQDSDILEVKTDDGNFQTESIMFAWSVKGFGFGTTTFYYENGTLFCDNETLSKDAVKMLLCKFVDSAQFID